VADNYVRILVQARDQATPDLDELKARLEELGQEVATARAEVDDADAAAKLDRLAAKLDDLDHRTANPKIRMTGALRAEADIHAVEAALDKLNRKAGEVEAEVETKGGSQGILGRLLMGSGSEGGGGAGGLASLGEGGLTSPYGLAAIAAGITALLPELAGIVSGFAAAGTGAGAFYLLAHPAISALETDYTNLSSAQTAYQKAQNVYAADPTTANAKALQTARDSLKAVQMSMSQDAGGAAAGLTQLRQEYGKLTTAFAPDVFKVFNAGLKVANTLLPDIMPFAKTFADVLDRLLGQAGKFVASTGFQDWLKQFHSLEGPATTAIGKGLGEVMVQLGKLLTVMSAKDVVNAINIAFSILSGTIDGLRHVVEAIMRAWDVTSKTVARDAREVATSFDALRHDIADFAHDVAAHFDEVRHDIADFAHDTAAHFDESRHDIAQWADDIRHDTDDVVTFFKRLPGDIMSALSSLGSLMFRAGVNAIKGLLDGMQSMIGGAVSTVEGWGHDLVNALGSPFGIHFSEPSEATQMIKAGQNVALGLAAGMLAGNGSVAAAARQLASSAAISPSAGTGPAVAGGGQFTLQITPGTGGSGLEQQFWTWLKNGVRSQGGDPRIFNKKVSFLGST
jgi:hypothetical protein